MEPQAVAIFVLAVAVMGHTLAYWVKSPKEVNSEQAEQLRAINTELKVQGTLSTRHDEAIKNLIVSIDRLTNRIDKLEPILRTTPPHGRRGTSAGR